MSTEIRILRPDDEALLLRAAPGVFDDPVRPAWAREFLADARHLIAVAIDEGSVVAMASGVLYVHPDKPTELWVNELAPRPRIVAAASRRACSARCSRGPANGGAARRGSSPTSAMPRRSTSTRASAERPLPRPR